MSGSQHTSDAGYKVGLRQLGFALNIHDGPLSVFLAANFADIYSPITVTLMNGAGEPLGKREVNLLHSVPCMPTLQAMRWALAKHPMLRGTCAAACTMLQSRLSPQAMLQSRPSRRDTTSAKRTARISSLIRSLESSLNNSTTSQHYCYTSICGISCRGRSPSTPYYKCGSSF